MYTLYSSWCITNFKLLSIAYAKIYLLLCMYQLIHNAWGGGRGGGGERGLGGGALTPTRAEMLIVPSRG